MSVGIGFDSGVVLPANTGDAQQVIYSTIVRASGAPWLRLSFDHAQLDESRGPGSGSYLRLTSTLDGAVQQLDAEQLRHWRNTSAYFNGDTVLVELIAFPGAGPSRISSSNLTMGTGMSHDVSRTVCGTTDDRQPVVDPRAGRIMPNGCTAWLFDDSNRTLLTAGHCAPLTGAVIEFNVPISLPDGTPVHPGPEDQYVVDQASVQYSSLTLGDDWCYFGCIPNAVSGLTPVQKQAAFYQTADATVPGASDVARITGYGTASATMPPAWNQAEKTGVGAYSLLAGYIVSYQADTTGGNSGSPIIFEGTQKAIGIHTSGSCTTTSGYNSGTAFQSQKLKLAIASPRSVCATGRSPVSGSLFAIGDLANNFGTLDRTTGKFGKLSAPIAASNALAYRLANAKFYAIDFNQKLFTISPTTGASWLVGPISGSAAPITDLVSDPTTDKLIGICQSTGQLVNVNPANGSASPIGTPGGGSIAALAFVPSVGRLLGMENLPLPIGSRLVSINQVTGQQSVIGVLGLGITSCRAMAYCEDDRTLYAIDGLTGNLLRVSLATGLATVVGSTGGSWQNTAAMTFARSRMPCRGDANFDGTTDTLDLTLILQRFGATVGPGTNGDVNGDGKVNSVDLVYTIAGLGCQ